LTFKLVNRVRVVDRRT